MRSRCTRSIILLALVSGVLLASPGRVRAAELEPDKAAANARFDEGKQLAAEGHYPEACARFEASLQLIPRLGVQLNLADCYEHLGRTASAWVMFSEAAAMANQKGDPREAFARERMAALTPRLTRLTIVVPQADMVEGLEVRRDGSLIPGSLYGVSVPVDPGEHAVTASAPGRLAWSMQVHLASDGIAVQVAVPALAPVPSPVLTVSSTAVPARPARESELTRAPQAPRHRTRTALTWTALGVGALGVGVGTYYGLSARSLWNDAQPQCPGGTCSGDAYAEAQRARLHGNVATVAFALGGAALATGLVLYLSTPREPERALRVTASPSGDGVHMSLSGAF